MWSEITSLTRPDFSSSVASFLAMVDFPEPGIPQKTITQGRSNTPANAAAIIPVFMAECPGLEKESLPGPGRNEDSRSVEQLAH